MVAKNDKEALLVMKNIIDKYFEGSYSRKQAVETLMYSIDPIPIYGSSDPMVTDCYFTIMYLTEAGYETKDVELSYFRDCFNGMRTYNMDDIIELTRKHI